jgi:hypothetical protein
VGRQTPPLARQHRKRIKCQKDYHCEGTGRKVRLSGITLHLKRLVSKANYCGDGVNAASDGAFAKITANARVTLTIAKLLFITEYLRLRRKQLEIMQVQREIEALNLAVLLLADDKRECAESSLPHGSELDRSFGVVQFLSQTPSRDRTLNKSNHSCDPKTLLAGLRRKQLEIMQVQREIEALNLAILLLADDKRECAESSLPHGSELDRRPWPSLGPQRAQQKPLSL